jgi:hypothetical protein
VIILRGIGGYFPYISEFEDELLEEGVCPTVAFPGAYRQVTERIIAAHNTGRLNGPLVIVGYSAGADKALRVSRCLGQRGLTVDKLVLLEPSSGGRVPRNVKECVNLYKTQPWNGYIPVFRGCTVIAESPETRLVNCDLRDFNDGRYDWDNHFTLAYNPYVQDLMVNEVAAAFNGEPDREEVLSLLDDGRDVNVAQEMPPSMN